MKKKLILILALVLISVVSVLCTIAFLMEEVEVANVMTVGSVHIELLEYERVNTETSGDAAVVQAFEDGKPLLPAVITDPSANEKFSYAVDYNSVGTSYVNWGSEENNIKANYKTPIWDPANITNEHDKMVFVRNTGNAKAYVRLYFAFEAGNYVRFERFMEAVHINYNEAKDGKTPIWNWSWDKTLVEIGVGAKRERYFIATATYYKPLEPNTTTEISLSQIALDSKVTLEEARGFGDEYKVLVKAQAMQCDGFDSADAALEKGFGNAYPFKNVKEVTFVDKLRNVLTKLNGDGTDIKSKVTSVTFGLTKDYAAKVVGHEGVLVANKSGEAVYTAYAYYVPNGENYDIYILADNWKIYTPNNSSLLFSGMTALTTVNTANMDVSHTTNMMTMFNGCSKLKTLEAGTWNVSSVTSFHSMFKNCDDLENIDVKNWNVSKVTAMQSMFEGCINLTVLDLSGWNTTNVTSCTLMFADCEGLETIYVGDGWDLSIVPENSTTEMFKECRNLKGGKGTTIAKLDAIEEIEDMDLINNTYAHIDGGESNPGYLTQGPAPATT